MTDKEIRRLRREDLLQILIDQQKRIDEMTAELESCHSELENRRITVANAGSMAEAALALNQVFDKASQAAQQYEDEMRLRCDEAKQQAEREAEQIVSQAREEAERIIAEAREEADGIVKGAKASAAPADEPMLDKPEPDKRHGLFGRVKRTKS